MMVRGGGKSSCAGLRVDDDGESDEANDALDVWLLIRTLR